jgi:predicted DNA-binding transcriptional regulator YafY
MPLNKNALARYIEIDRCLRNNMHQNPTKEYLIQKIADRLGTKVSASTFDKDIADLKLTYNAPIGKIYLGKEGNKKKWGYKYEDPTYSFSSPFTQKDQWIMDFAAAAVNVYGYSVIMDEMLKLNKVINKGEVHYDQENASYNCIQIESSSIKIGYNWLFDFYMAIQELAVLSIDYHPFEKNAGTKLISPYLLKESKGLWYMVGYDHKSKMTKVFALDRIKNLARTKEVFIKDAKFEAYEYFRYSVGVYHKLDAIPERVVLKFSAEIKPYILARPIHDTQIVLANSANGIAIEITVYDPANNYELKNMIMGYGSRVTVLEPESLRQVISQEAAAIKKLYQSS